MFVRVKALPTAGRRSVQLCESTRQGNKVRQVIVRHVGIAADDEEEAVLRELAKVAMLKEEQARSETGSLFAARELAESTRFRSRKSESPPPLPTSKPDSLQLDLRHVVEESRQVEGVSEVLGSLYDELGLDTLLSGAPKSVLKATVLARIDQPSSKRRTRTQLEQSYGQTYSLDQLYRMMDALAPRIETMQKLVRMSTVKLCDNQLDVCFFDVTTLYFESVVEDELRSFGYSKDQKFHQVQVVLALMTTEQGLPVGYKLFPGSTAEVKTLIACVEQWKQDAAIGKVTFVADRGMMSEANLQELEQAGFHYVVGASLKKLPALLQRQVLAPSRYRIGVVDSDAVWTKTLPLEGSRQLIATFSSARAHKDASDRARLLDSLNKRLGKKAKAPVKSLVSNRGYLTYSTVEGQATATVNQEKVQADAQWDGMYGLVTNIPDAQPLKLLARYRALWTIEQAFRIHKHNLAMRPIFHWKKRRIEAHVALCFLAYTLLRHAQFRLRQAGLPLSVEALRDELVSVQASLLRDTSTGRLFRIPSKTSHRAHALYRAFGLRRASAPELLPR